MKKRIFRALTIAAIAALIIGGAVYAYETLWSGTACITIESPTNGGQLEVTGVSVSKGTWDESSKTWTVSLQRGTYAILRVEIQNDGGDAIAFEGWISDKNPAPGITLYWYGAPFIPAGETGSVSFHVGVAPDAEPGEVPNITLEIREKP